MIPLPSGLFTTIVADPPWPYRAAHALPSKWLASRNGVGQGVAAADRYALMSMDDLKAMRVSNVVADDAHLYLWTTNSFMVEAHDLARAWGFVPKTIITWVKTKKDTAPEDEQSSMKNGYWFRSATEHVLFAVRGRLRLIGPPCPTAFFHGRLPHSVKPDAFFSLVERESPGPYLELFARRLRSGWTTWGNEVHVRMPVPVRTPVA